MIWHYYRSDVHNRRRNLAVYTLTNQEKRFARRRQCHPTLGPAVEVASYAKRTNPSNYMSVYKPFSRYSLLTVFAVVIVAGTWSLIERNRLWSDIETSTNPSNSAALFSPSEDLESPDIKLLNSATSTIDVAMYAFTDERIESSLSEAARRGVKIRIYRDSLQLEAEEARASRNGERSPTDRLKAIPGIEVRVKARGQSMHLKAYCVDRKLLRTGSANWSPQGEMSQDNDLYVISDQRIVHKFETDFDSIWARADNASH